VGFPGIPEVGAALPFYAVFEVGLGVYVLGGALGGACVSRVDGGSTEIRFYSVVDDGIDGILRFRFLD